MNAVSEFIERIGIGGDPDLADVPLLDFGDDRHLTRRQCTESILGIGSMGSGKTTLARTITRGLLRDRFGGLILCVKGSQIEEIQTCCRAESREKELIHLGPGTGHVFNPLAHERSSAEAAALVSELAEVLGERVRDGGENDAFWRTQLNIILRNLFVLCRVAYGYHDLVLVAELFDCRANTLSEVLDPTWLKDSPMAGALAKARVLAGDSDAKLAVDYFTRAFPMHGDRLQGSLAATVSGVFDHLRREPLQSLFTGQSTFTMDDLLDDAKLCVVGLPVLDSADGRIANALMQFCFCRAATRRLRKSYSFLLSDECQETVTRELMRKRALLREFKVATVLFTQNIAVLDDRLGETAREAFCGLAGIKIFGQQGHAATRQWASDEIGKRKVPVETKTTGSSHAKDSSGRSTSTSVHEHWDYRVPPSRFAELRVGETICLRAGQVWRSRWHRDHPGRKGTVRIVD
jgi:type IV secretory pathway TraG/TraD family ATPase VirD4